MGLRSFLYTLTLFAGWAAPSAAQAIGNVWLPLGMPRDSALAALRANYDVHDIGSAAEEFAVHARGGVVLSTILAFLCCSASGRRFGTLN